MPWARWSPARLPAGCGSRMRCRKAKPRASPQAERSALHLWLSRRGPHHCLACGASYTLHSTASRRLGVARLLGPESTTGAGPGITLTLPTAILKFLVLPPPCSVHVHLSQSRRASHTGDWLPLARLSGTVGAEKHCSADEYDRGREPW